MSTSKPDESRAAAPSEPKRRGLLAKLGALVAGGVGLFSLQTTAEADWDDDDGYYDDPYYGGGYYYDPYWGGYYYYDDDDGWDDDDGGDDWDD